MVFEPTSEEALNVVITGNTWNFRDALEAHGATGARKEDDSRAYYRYMVDVDILNDKQKILGLFEIFHNQVVRILIDPEPEGAVAEFFEELKKDFPCAHFA